MNEEHSPAADADRTSEARRILEENDRGGYTVPTARLYPFQWNWDSAFTALGWAEFDMARAWLEIDTLFLAQWPSGMVPHIVFWTDEPTYFPGASVWGTQGREGPATSGISQPPVAATVVRTLSERARTLPQPELVSKIDHWHRWWHTARDPQDRGIIAIAHPWESGRDNLPDWDAPLAAVDASNVSAYQRRDLDVVDASMRPHKSDYDRYLALVEFGATNGWVDDVIAHENPFFVADPGISAILLRAERDLVWLLDALGMKSAEAQDRVDRLERGFEQFWNPEANTYCSFDLRTGIYADTGTSASFLAPYAGVTARAEELTAELAAWAEACRFLVPSFDPRHPGFEPIRYWRGPVWCMVNYMISTGMREIGNESWADRIQQSSRDLISLSGMAEAFDPVTGGPVGGGHFAWTAALWLSWADAT